MRQVPALDGTPIGIVGDGRAARHFLRYLNLLGRSVRVWSRRMPGAGPVEAFAPCRTVLVLIRDADIVPFIDAWPDLHEKQLVHLSGSLVTHAAQGVHPLMTFGHELYDLATYRSIPFILDSGGAPLHQLLPGLPNPSFTIPAAAAHPYLSQTTANLLKDASRALTGPLARRDLETISMNMKALDGDPFHDVYSAFARAYERRS